MTKDQRLWVNEEDVLSFPVIFKYYNKEIGLSALKESTLQFSHPSRFNDPFDCNVNLFEFTEEDTQAFCNYIFEKSVKGDEEREQLFYKNYQELVRTDFKRVMERLIERENSDRGISCFSKISNNLLMWAHYASNHKGICIGYDILKLRNFMRENKISVFFKVNYVEAIEPQTYFSERESALGYWLTTKQISWQYEQEVRLISEPFQFDCEKSTILNIPMDIIKEVTLGYGSEEKTRVEVINLVSNKIPHAKVYQIQPNYRTFELDRFELNL